MKDELIFEVTEGIGGISMKMGVLGKETPIKDKNGTQLKIGDVVIAKVNKNDLVSENVSSVTIIVENKEVAFPMGFELIFKVNDTLGFNVTLEKIKGYEEFELGEIFNMNGFSGLNERISFIYGVEKE